MTRGSVRPSSFDWKVAPDLSVPSSINRYLEACTEWVLGHQADTSEHVVHAARWPFQRGDTRTNVALSKRDIMVNRQRECIACGELTQRHIIGNPFSHRHWVAVCVACHAEPE